MKGSLNKLRNSLAEIKTQIEVSKKEKYPLKVKSQKAKELSLKLESDTEATEKRIEA